MTVAIGIANKPITRKKNFRPASISPVSSIKPIWLIVAKIKTHLNPLIFSAKSSENIFVGLQLEVSNIALFFLDLLIYG